jgi:hypothetical protein
MFINCLLGLGAAAVIVRLFGPGLVGVFSWVWGG